jgi:hypothetical protein
MRDRIRVQVVLAANGRIMSYALVGDIEGSQTITIPGDTDLSLLSHARWDGEKLIELPADPEPDPAETISALQQQVADLQAQMSALTGDKVGWKP